MTKKAIFIGGPRHGESIDLNDSSMSFPIDMVKNKHDMLQQEERWTYSICQTADGVFYAVYNPLADPSIERVKMLRDAILGAIDGQSNSQ